MIAARRRTKAKRYIMATAVSLTHHLAANALGRFHRSTVIVMGTPSWPLEHRRVNRTGKLRTTGQGSPQSGQAGTATWLAYWGTGPQPVGVQLRS